MREDGDTQNPGLPTLLTGGAQTFHHRGASGGWEEIFNNALRMPPGGSSRAA